MVLACSGTGLCNRLNNYAGSARVAATLGRPLKLWWPLNWHLGVRWEDLFKTEVQLASQEDLERVFNPANTVKVYNAKEFPGVAHSQAMRPSDQYSVIVVKSWQVPRFEDEGVGRSRDLAWPWLSALRPTDRIQAAIDSVVISPSIGVHARRSSPGDQFFRFDAATDDLFIEAVKDALETRPGIGIFLATDNPQFEEMFKREFPGTVTNQRRHHGHGARQSVDGMTEAMVDLYTLAKCEIVVGTFGSSFSRVGAWLGNKPFVGVGKV